jgi:formate dehydrogenase major subunit
MTISVDGREMDAGGSLLDVILAAGISLPHLCKDDNLPAIGACRTCLVESDGRVVAACSYPAADVKEVQTATDRVTRLRRIILELTAAMQSAPGEASLGPHGNEAAETVRLSGAEPGRYDARTGTHVDRSAPFFSFHEESCILCGRCVVACQALQHISAIGLAGRGRQTRVTPGADESFRESICTSCGSCVAACPTPALRPREGGF